MTPAGQVGFDAVLQGTQAGLFQPAGLCLGEGSVGHVGQGGTPPQGQRLPQRRRRPTVIPGLGLVASPGDELLEAQGVNRRRIDLQLVSGRAGDHRLTGRPQGLAQAGDVDPQRMDGALGGIPAPQVLGQAFRRDCPVRMEHEQSENGPFPAATKGQALYRLAPPPAARESGTGAGVPPRRPPRSA